MNLRIIAFAARYRSRTRWNLDHDGIANRFGGVTDWLAELSRKIDRRLDRLDLDFRVFAMRPFSNQKDGELLAVFLRYSAEAHERPLAHHVRPHQQNVGR